MITNLITREHRWFYYNDKISNMLRVVSCPIVHNNNMQGHLVILDVCSLNTPPPLSSLSSPFSSLS